jgi:DNA processing protein
MASMLGADLARAGVAVVSGLARGVDAAAHRGCLEAGGASFAVLATTPETPYPRDTSLVHRQLVERGAVCAEYPRGTRLTRGLFVRRNRIVAGLCRGVVVVEAGVHSGALSTAAWAERCGLFVAAVPGDVIRENSGGTLFLLRRGAVPVGSAGDVLELLSARGGRAGRSPSGIVPPGAGKGRSAAAQASGAETLLAELRTRSGTPGELALRIGSAAAQVQARLTLLEIAGRVTRDTAGRYRLAAGPVGRGGQDDDQRR